MGYDSWANDQFDRNASLQLPHLDSLMRIDQNVVKQDKRQEIWFRNALQQGDQLRQRMAFALSQVSVMSDKTFAAEENPNAVVHYYDALSQSAFENYRTFISNVTLHHVMGHYPSMYKNRKLHLAGAIRPDELLGRELMQLFSIGLVRLNTHGTALDGEPETPGTQPIRTHRQDKISGFSLSVHQYAATLAPLYGLSNADLLVAFPNVQTMNAPL